MTKTMLLDNIAHADLRIAQRTGAAFGDAVNQTLIFPTEVEAVQREFPILIQKDAESAWQLTALLGLDRDENLFLGADGWTSRYVPAVHRRGPFLIGIQSRDGMDHPVVHIDLDDPRVGDEGEPLFLPHGGNGPHLDRVADTLRTIHEGHMMMQPMFAAFEMTGLLAPVALDIELDDAQRYAIHNRFTIDADRLAQLSGDDLLALNQTGFLGLAFAIRSSLANVEYLILRKRARMMG
ncbi:SapC family protein [Sphingobium sp. BYY-5]|uniref:SapC family protein n=1 Tax=Sphingobium sp. BYY-5 TaxID=2926400 RepID=UPI001FA72BB5|nr:SapC family protein [Sphingobium sp. BYY-5]MCI4591693.1 SapC family protein [Sphingobium sp. BYY-5]